MTRRFTFRIRSACSIRRSRYYTGFKVNSGEYKLMGLAPYGERRHVQQILDNLIDLKEDGSFQINQEYFDYCTGLTMTNAKFDSLFGAPARTPEDPVKQCHMDLAASIQAVLEEAVFRITRGVASETGMENLCMAGGVALNCVANGKVLRAGHFKKIWIQPASGDAGAAIGAALAAYHLYQGKPRARCGCGDAMKGSYLGPSFQQQTSSAAFARRARRSPFSMRTRSSGRCARGAGGRKGAGMVPGTNGVWPSGAGRTFDSGRRQVARRCNRC